MIALFAGFTGLEIFFAICAIVGGIFTLIRLVLQFVGGEVDGDVDADIDLDEAGPEHADSDIGFKILSLQSLSSFLLMFGLVGLAMSRQSGYSAFPAVAGGSLAGVASVWLIGKIFALFNKLQSSGTLPNAAARGATGTVYLTIPEAGVGRVTLRVRERLREYDAMASDGKAIPTDSAVEVVDVRDDVMIVTKLS